MTAHRPPEPPDAAFVEVPSGDVVWRFERAFMTSRWRCRFGDGCHGILPERAAELGQGCCSLGAHFGDGEPGQEEARTLSAYVALLTPERWQHHAVGTTDLYWLGTGILMTSVLLAGLIARQRRGPGGIGVESVAMLAIYLLAAFFEVFG